MVIAIFIAYKPDLCQINRAVQSLLDQVDFTIVIDNSPLSSLCFKSDKLIIEVFNTNIGIAAAQNVGLRKAMDLGADFVILSDQDSVYPSDYVSSMLTAFDRFPNACAVVPKFINTLKRAADGFTAIRPFFFQHFFPHSGLHEVLQAIASGKVIKVSSLDAIGFMSEDLFIDWVDFEWCWRARSKGFSIIGNSDVVIQHQLGDTAIDIGFREITLRTPIRHYFIVRNAVYLALYCTNLDLGHRSNLFLKSLQYLFCYPVLTRPHLTHLKAVTVGLWHGVIKRLGKYEL